MLQVLVEIAAEILNGSAFRDEAVDCLDIAGWVAAFPNVEIVAGSVGEGAHRRILVAKRE